MQYFIRYALIFVCVSQYLLTFAQIKPPVPVCYNGLSADLMPSGTVTLLADAFNAGSYDKNAPLKSLKLKVQSPAPKLNDLYNPAFASDSITFDCIGWKSVGLWVGNPSGVWAFCESYIKIENNLGAKNVPACPDIPDVFCNEGKKVEIAYGTGSQSCSWNGLKQYKVNNGAWMPPKTFIELKNNPYCAPSGSKFTVEMKPPSGNILTGVSTLDIVLISKHILGTATLKNPNAQLAADVNCNGVISTADLVAMRKVILGTAKTFPCNKTWIIKPLTPGIVRQNDTTLSLNITQDTTMRFLPIQLGDVNGSAAECGLATGKENKQYFFPMNEKILNSGETYTLKLDNEVLDGYQFTLDYDSEALELLQIDDNSAAVEVGKITTSQLKGEQFEAVFKVKKQISVATAFHLNSDKTSKEGYIDDERFDIDFSFAQQKKLVVSQNQPNPFAGQTQIRFYTQSDNIYHFAIIDAFGRVIQQIAKTPVKGENIIDINLPQSGVYYYSITQNAEKIIKKMVAQ
jgi:Secretion system C-terminal sorting domain